MDLAERFISLSDEEILNLRTKLSLKSTQKSNKTVAWTLRQYLMGKNKDRTLKHLIK